MQTSRKQSNLTKAVRFVIRSLSHGHSQVPGTISSAVRRYQVSPHDIWVAIQSTEHWLIGLDLAGQLKREKSSLKVISSSGYGPDRASAARTAGQEITIFPKPYKVAALAQTVRGCLDHP